MFSIVICAALTLLPFEFVLLQTFREYAMHIMLGLLAIGMLFFILDEKELMFTSLISSAMLCIFLKDASHPALFYPRESQTSVIRVVHINAASAERQYEDVLEILLNQRPDIITVQECTPDWLYFFDKTLKPKYPYVHQVEMPISFGSAVFSQHELESLDTVYIDQIPNLITKAHVDEDNELTLVNTYLHSPEIPGKTRDIEKNLEAFSNIISVNESPVLNLGDFNLTYWSGVILNYRLQTGLHNSRKGLDLSQMYVPYDHMFYSDQLECVKFFDLQLENEMHIGMVGDFKFVNLKNTDTETYSSKIMRF